ncbi:MAG: exodeoxyribonuclease VII large subunit [Planctomycetota bacterium]|nr:exodeoxyribonuclease VII large subunit [Planctomycetota bacterium]
MKRLEWQPDLGRIVIRFSYDPLLVAEVKKIPGRQWHRDQKLWSVPLDSVGEAARILMPLGFDPAPEVERCLNGEVEGLAGIGEQVAEAATPSDQVNAGWSVTRLNETVRDVLQSSVPETIWLQGEVLEFDRNRQRDHIFFKIVEKVEGEDRPRASVTAVLFLRNKDRVLKRFAETETDLADGLQIRVQVRVDLYVQNGSYQVVVEDIDPTYTLGEIAQRRERIMAEIRKRGLEQQNLSIPWPLVPLRIGVLTSPDSDAWKDLIHELRGSGFAFEVALYGVHVQGERTEREVLEGLKYFEQRAAEFDVLLLVRGGGSRADLMAFDSLPLALAVAQHPLKIMVGIGHQADRSVLDDLSHSEKTPTAAGQQLVQQVSGFWQRVRDQGARIMIGARHRVDRCRADLNGSRSQIARGTSLAMLEQRRRLQLQASGLESAAAGQLGEARGTIRASRQRLSSGTARVFRVAADQRSGQEGRLQASATLQLARERERLAARQVQVRGADPQTILARGFAWVRDQSGHTIGSHAGVSIDQKVTVRFVDGVVDARIEATRSDSSVGLSSR